jgi:hypothetical protein
VQPCTCPLGSLSPLLQHQHAAVEYDVEHKEQGAEYEVEDGECLGEGL